MKIQETQQVLTRTVKNSQERARENKAQQILSSFTIPQGLRLVPYTIVRISTIKRSNQISLQKNNLLPASKYFFPQ